MRALWKSWLNVFRGAILIDASGLAGAFGGVHRGLIPGWSAVCVLKTYLS